MVATTGFKDRYGMALSTSSAVAAARYVEGIDLLLSYNLGLDLKLSEAIMADEGFAMAHAALAVIYQLRGDLPMAQASAARATALENGISRREQQHIKAIATIMRGDGPKALELIQEHLAEFPRDALLLFQANMLLMYSGQQDRRQQTLALLESVQSHYGEDWWFMGMLSFVYHELDRFEESRRFSERSLDFYPRNANAAHNLAHVFYETVDHTSGLDFLNKWLTDYERQAPFHCHLSWHIAMFEMAAGRYGRAMELFEEGIRGNAMSRSALPDAASLLWRCQLYGYNQVTLPWDAAREFAVRLASKPGFAFNDAHAALVHVAMDDSAALENLQSGLRELATQGHPVAGQVVLPLVKGLQAFGQRQYEEAIYFIEPIAPELVRIGGSHAQREIFEDTLLIAYLRSGHYAKAESLLRQRLFRREWARDYFWLASAQSGAGNNTAAQSSRHAALQRWPNADLDAPELV